MQESTTSKSRGYKFNSARFLLAPLAAFPDQSEGDSGPAAPPNAGRFGRKSECFVHAGDIGLYIRYLCILKLVFERLDSSGTTATEARAEGKRSIAWRATVNVNQANWPSLTALEARLAAAFPDRLNGKPLSLRGCLSNEAADTDAGDGTRGRKKSAESLAAVPRNKRLWSTSGYLDESKSSYQIFDTCVQQIRDQAGCQRRTLKDILLQPIARPGEGVTRETIERFCNWLESDRKLLVDDLSRLQPDLYLLAHQDDRWNHLEHVAAMLLGDTDGASMPLSAVWSPGGSNWSGLRAFCTSLCIRLKERQAKVPRSQRYALAYVPLRSLPSNQGNARPTRRSVLDILLKFFDLPPQTQGSPESEISDMVRINRALTMHRAIVIFDGLEIDDGELGPLMSLVRGSDWCGLIRNMAQVDEGAFIDGGGRYLGRSLVLSNREPHPLLPWIGLRIGSRRPPTREAATSSMQGQLEELRASGALSELPPSLNPAEAQRYILEPDYKRAELEALQTECMRLWPSKRSRPQARQETLPVLSEWFSFNPNDGGSKSGQYARNQDRIRHRATAKDLMEALTREANGVPSELDLTLAWCAFKTATRWPDNHNDVARQQRPARLMHMLQDYVYNESPEDSDLKWPQQGVAIVLQLIALSIGGLRTHAIVRMLGMFASRIVAESRSLAADVLTVRDSLANEGDHKLQGRLHVLLQLTEDHEQPALPESARWYELDAGEPGTELKASDGGRRFFDLRLQEVRDWLICALIDSPDGRQRFHLLNEVIAEENLSIATSQIRRMASGVMSDAQSLRCFVQVAYSGLLSLDPQRLEQIPQDGKALAASRLPSRGALPDDHYRRWTYLYEFVFRMCIENAPNWTLSRGLAMHEVRAALLAMFVDPARALDVLKRRCISTHVVPLVQRQDKLSQRHMRGAPGVDLMEALLRSSIGVRERWELARSASQLNRYLQFANEQEFGIPAINADQSRPWFEFHKIAVDAALRHDLTATALVETGKFLTLAGIEGADTSLAQCSDEMQSSGWNREYVESNALRTFSERLLMIASERSKVERMHDALARHGEALARQADMQDKKSLQHTLFAQAYCAFFVSDRLRAHAANDPLSTDWPLMSARVMRASIRVALKLAKEVAKLAIVATRSDDATGARNRLANALSYYAYARSRVAVYTRHTHRFQSERLHGVLLLVAVARVRSFIAAVQHEIHATLGGSSGEVPAAFVGMAREYLGTAHEQLFRHDFNDRLIKRFLIERLKTRSLTASQLRTEGNTVLADANAALVQRDWHVLRRLSNGNAYWEEVVFRLAKHLLPSPEMTSESLEAPRASVRLERFAKPAEF